MENKTQELVSKLKKQGYEDEWIKLYFIKKFPLENSDAIHEVIQRINQAKFRKKLIERDSKCIISGSDAIECEAAHIIPYAECNQNINSMKKMYERSNGLLLNLCLHKLFDKYIFSINPWTSEVKVRNGTINLSICPYNNKIVKIPSECKDNLIIHYQNFLMLQNRID